MGETSEVARLRAIREIVADPVGWVPELSKAERAVAGLACRGFGYDEIKQRTGYSTRSVYRHMASAAEKIGRRANRPNMGWRDLAPMAWERLREVVG